MAAFPNPALDALLARISPEFVVGQVLVRRCDDEFELCHIEDRDLADLAAVPLSELRVIGQFTASHEYRPLRAAPTLRRGWHCRARNQTELETAMQHLYPGALADWYAAQQPEPPLTPLRDFINRQTGVYHLAAELGEAELREVVETCCDRRFCLKRRLWPAAGLAPDAIDEKTVIPCLEPCAILLEFARRAALIAREEKLEVRLAPSDAAVIRAALEGALARQWPVVREADFSSPAHPRRVQLALARLDKVLPGKRANERSRLDVV